MKFQELVILLPCHSLEDFPVYSEGEEAQGLLAAWTALWHPALIHSAQAMPTWCRMDEPPDEVEGRLLLIPPVAHTELPTGFFQRVKESGGCPIRRKLHRDEILSIALEALDDAPEFQDEWIADFLALGFAYLQVQILTRQMRYSSNLDEVHFANQVVAAVNEAAAGNHEAAEQRLTACYDLLSEERDLFYSVDSFVVELIMLTPTAVGARLEQDLIGDSPANLLLSAGVLDALENNPVLPVIRRRINEGSLSVLACDQDEMPLPLLPIEAVGSHVAAGLAQAEQVLEQRPAVFGRRRYGLTPTLPGLLKKLGLRFAMHATLEEGRFPEGGQIKSQWQGVDDATVDALAKPPLNASLAETFLGLALKTGESMDMDHVATIVLAHWPGQASPYMEDLRRAARRTTALGKFITVEAFFNDTDEPNHSERFPASRFRSPYLKQSVIRRHDAPLSRWSDYHLARAHAVSAQALQCIAASVSGAPSASSEGLIATLDRGCEADDGSARESHREAAAASESKAVQAATNAMRTKPGDGLLLWNPHPTVRRTLVSLDGFASLPAPEGHVYAIENGANGPQAIVDVPPMGYAYVQPGNGQLGKRDPLLAEGLQLRNEFFEVLINQKSGGIASVQSYETRGNRMSQQIAMRLPTEGSERGTYSKMVAEKCEVVVATRLEGAIRTGGRLLNEAGETVARFNQTARIVRGSRVLELDIELSEVVELKSDPWNAYVASRIAWKDEAAEVACDVNQVRQVMGDRKRLEAPHYVEIRNAAEATTIFPMGLPYHRRVGFASMDTLLVVRNEPQRRFRIGIGVDVAYPLHESIGLAAPPQPAEGRHATPQAATAWMYHLQARNVTATSWLPTIRDGKAVGFETRLLETAGRGGQVKLRSLRPIQSAQVVDLRGNVLSECPIENDAAQVELAANEWLIVRAEWAL